MRRPLVQEHNADVISRTYCERQEFKQLITKSHRTFASSLTATSLTFVTNGMSQGEMENRVHVRTNQERTWINHNVFSIV